MDGGSLEFGHTVYACIPNSKGQACDDPHPAVVLRRPNAAGDLWLIGISTRFDEPIRFPRIELPWSEAGHPTTGLWRRCVLVCDWVVPWRVDRIIRRLGILLSEIMDKATDYVIKAVEEKKKISARGSSSPQ